MIWKCYTKYKHCNYYGLQASEILKVDLLTDGQIDKHTEKRKPVSHHAKAGLTKHRY